MAKQATIHGYYTSKIGIHEELRYKGNQFLARVRRLPDRRRQGLSALRAEASSEAVEQLRRCPTSERSRHVAIASSHDRSTLDVNLTRALDESKRLADSIKPGSDRWDVIVVGSGAAGGMAAFQLAMAGIKVLLLEAGRMIDVRTEYRTMEWPYASMRRQPAAARRARRSTSPSTASSIARTATNPAFAKYKKLTSYAANRSRATGWWTRGSTRRPARRTRGCARASSAARRTSGAAARCATDRCSSTPPAATASTSTGRSRYDDVKPYYDKVDVLLGCSGHATKGSTQVPDGVFQRPSKLNCVEVAFKRAIAKMGRHYIPGRAGVTTDGVLNNKYRARCAGPRPVRPRLRHPGGVPLADGAHLSGARQRQPDRAARTRWCPRCSSARPSNRATGVRVIDANTREVMDFKAPVVVLGAGALDTTRILLNSRSSAHPDGLGNSSGVLGCYLSEHIMGIRGSGYIPARIGTEATLDDGRPVAPYIPRFRNVTDGTPTSSAATISRAAAAAPSIPSMAHDIAGLREGVQVERAQVLSRPDQLRRLWRGAAAQGEPRHARSAGEGRVGHPGPAVRLHLPRQRAEDGQGHGRLDRGDADGGARRGHQDRARAAAARLVDPRDRHGAHGRRSARRRSPTASAGCTTRRTSTSPTRRRSSAAARRTPPGRSWRWRGGRWTI